MDRFRVLPLTYNRPSVHRLKQGFPYCQLHLFKGAFHLRCFVYISFGLFICFLTTLVFTNFFILLLETEFTSNKTQ